MMGEPLWVEVLVDCMGASGLYTYRVPEGLRIQPGDIVSVFFGAQQVGAIAIRQLLNLPEGLDPASIKSIEEVVNTTFFTKEYWQLLNRVADYYQTPFIRVLKAALPPGLLSKSQRRIRLSRAKNKEKIKYLIDSLKLSESAQLLLETLGRSPEGDYSWQYLRQQLRQQIKSPRQTGSATQALRQLKQSGLVESYLAAPRSPRAQKRQAVILISPANTPFSPVQFEPGQSEPVQFELSARQQSILAGLSRLGGELWLSDALQQLHTTSKTLKKIAALGYLVIEPREVLRVGSHSQAQPDEAKSLTADQAQALATLRQMQGYEEALLHGVTGSGKTEVYLQAIAPILAAKKSALVLVPEIGLTPQLTDRFRSRFGQQVCIYHSGLSEGERYDTWRQMLTNEPQIIIGTRSAVFSPLKNLGVIILDEEHDSSFKQDQPMPCYHAQQVARWRAELEGCPLILGSATPALETWVRFREVGKRGSGETRFAGGGSLLADSFGNGEVGNRAIEVGNGVLGKRERRHYLSLPQRVHARPLPPIELVDMRQELRDGNRTIFSRQLQTALEELVEKGNQGILFIHRRGHSSFVSCRSCGEAMQCPNCDVSLSFHQTHSDATAQLKCHYCGYSQRHPETCPQCSSPYLKTFGSGTQRVVNDLKRYLPQARCLRFDSDTTRNKGAHRALLTRFANGEADLLIGTQMLTKGIDLPQVTLVGVIAADGLLFMPDYRASERAFQTITQVAGRAGRGEQPGRVIVQTYSPEHPAIQALVSSDSVSSKLDAPHMDAQAALSQAVSSQSASSKEPQSSQPQSLQSQSLSQYGEFLQQELSDRAALDYPPCGRLILLRLSGLDERATENAAARLVNKLEAIAGNNDSYSILGPVPAPIFRVARRYRWHILLKLKWGAIPPPLRRLRAPKGISLTIDVDPLNLA
ncbi:MAG: primosomal protein N' [Cyanobacteria bacterium J06621_11]